MESSLQLGRDWKSVEVLAKNMVIKGDYRASQVVLVVKNLPNNAGDVKRCRFDLWVGKTPWRRAWQPTPVFLPGESPWTEEPDRL